MRVLVKYPSNALKRSKLTLDVNPQEIVSHFKKTVMSLMGPIKVNIILHTEISGIKVLMTDSFPLSFFQLRSDSVIQVQRLESSPTTTSRKFSRHSTYLESLGYTNYFPLTREHGPLDRAIEACKSGRLDELMKVAEIYESESPDDEDVLNQSQPCK